MNSVEMKTYRTRLRERAFVKIIIERVESNKEKHGAFASRVWPDITKKAATNKWLDIRRGARHTGKPQSLDFSDSILMAEALNADLPNLVQIAFERADAQLGAQKFEELKRQGALAVEAWEITQKKRRNKTP